MTLVEDFAARAWAGPARRPTAICNAPVLRRTAARRPGRVQAVLAALAMVTLAHVPRLAATSVVAKSFRSISAEAEQIFSGTVLETRSYRSDNGHIWTAVKFGDLTWFAGSGRAETELSFAGGTIGDRSEIVAGMPRFSQGQRVLLFVRDRDTVSPIVGFHQGCFRLVPSGAREVVTTVGKQPVLSVENGELVTGVAGETEDAISVDELMSVVAELRKQEGVE